VLQPRMGSFTEKTTSGPNALRPQRSSVALHNRPPRIESPQGRVARTEGRPWIHAKETIEDAFA